MDIIPAVRFTGSKVNRIMVSVRGAVSFKSRASKPIIRIFTRLFPSQGSGVSNSGCSVAVGRVFSDPGVTLGSKVLSGRTGTPGRLTIVMPATKLLLKFPKAIPPTKPNTTKTLTIICVLRSLGKAFLIFSKKFFIISLLCVPGANSGR